jgi:glycosyltransferase involved in cell wall biosynthesis
MKKPKVTILFSPFGGLAHYVAHLARPLSKFCQLQFVTYRKWYPTGEIVKSLTDFLLKKTVKRAYFLIEHDNPSSLEDLVGLIRKNKSDLVNIQFGTSARAVFPYYVKLLNQLKNLKIPVVLTCHDVLPHIPEPDDLKNLSQIYSKADHFIVGNEQELEKLKKTFEIPKTKISLVKHGVYNLFDQKRYSEKQAKNRLKLSGKKVILFFGWLRRYKGLSDLIKAMPDVLKQIPNAFLYISAQPAWEAEKDKVLYLNEIKKLGLSKNVRTHFNYLPTEKVELLFKAADLVALPYTTVSQSGILNLAFAFKKPVIISNLFEEAKTVDKKMGLVVPPKSPKILAKAIIEILKDPQKAKKYGQRGFQYGQKELSFKKVAQKTYSAYQKAIKK